VRTVDGDRREAGVERRDHDRPDGRWEVLLSSVSYC
jgi:hypothetical protein